MVDTPRTQAYLTGTAFTDGQPQYAVTLQSERDFIVSVLNIVPASVSAAGTTQGTATVLTAQLNVVTTVAAGTGVVATATYTKIWNAGANDLLVYPITSAHFEALGTNLPILVPVGGAVEIVMTSGTQGYAR